MDGHKKTTGVPKQSYLRASQFVPTPVATELQDIYAGALEDFV